MVNKLVKKSAFAEMAGVSNAAITKACKPGAALAAAMVGKQINAIHPAAVEYLNKQNDVQAKTLGDGTDAKHDEALQWCQSSGRWTVAGIHEAIGISKERARRLLAIFKADGLIPVGKVRSTTPIPQTPKKAPPPPATVEQPTARVISGQEAKRQTKKEEALERLGEGTTLHEIPENITMFADMTLRELIQRFGTDTAFLDFLKAVKTIEDINDRRIKNAEARGELVSRKLVKVAIIDPINSAHTKLLTDGAKTIARRVVAMTGSGRTLEECEAFVVDQLSSFIRPVKSKVARVVQELDQ